MRYQLLVKKQIKPWLMAMLTGALLLTLFIVLMFFVMPEKSVKANAGTQFNANDHQGKFVAMGGRTWVIMDVIDGKPYLMMDSIYAKRPWNSSGDSSDASEIFQFLEDEFNNIITVAEDRDMIADTEWEIRSLESDNFYIFYTDVAGKPIDPSSVTQKLGIISFKDHMVDYCREIMQVVSDQIWMRSPDHSDPSRAYFGGVTHTPWGSGCISSNPYVTSSYGIQPALYLEDWVRIRGGTGTEDDPYVLSVTDDPDPDNIEADGTTDQVTVLNVPAGATVKVYAANGTTQIGSKTNGGSPGTVVVTVSTDLRLNDKVYVSFTQPSKAESSKVEATVIDKEPPTINLSVSPATPTNQEVTVTAEITDSGSDVVEKKWALGARNTDFFSSSGQNLTGNTFEVSENGTYTVYAKDAAGNDAVKQITISNIDRSPPTLSKVSIQSNNAHANWAKVGDTIELAFEASEKLKTDQSEVMIAGNKVSIENTSDLNYRATYIMQATDPEGKVNFSIKYRDLAGNVGTEVTNTTDNSQVVFDKTAPAINFSQNGNSTPAKTAASIVTVTDLVSGVHSGTLEFVWTQSTSKPTSGWESFSNAIELKLEDLTANGNWYLHIQAKDNAGNESHASTNAFLLDNIAPEITLIGYNPLTIEAGSTYSDPGARATDNQDGDLTDDIVVMGEVDTDTDGEYTLTYQVTDQAGNTAMATRTIIVEQGVPPIIQFIPNGNSTPAKTAASTVNVTDEGSGVDEATLEYVWSDSVVEPTDGWQSFTSGANVKLEDLTANGNWYLHVRAKDKAGNESYTVSHAFILDNTAPVISLIGNNPFYVPHGNEYTEPGASATDNIDGDLSDSIKITGNVDTDKMKLYERYYTVSDRAGNSSTVTRTVYVYDGSAPIIYLQGANPMYVEAGSTFTDPGATAMDKQDGDLTDSIVVTGTVDPKTIGTYMLTYNVSDSGGNHATTVTRTVYVQDTQPPTLVLLGDPELTLRYGATFDDPGAEAVDSYYGDISHLIEVIGSVDTMQSGTYILRYRVQDPSGNRAEEQIRTVHVQKKPSSSSPTDGSSGSGGSGSSEKEELGSHTGLFIDVNGSLVNAVEIDTSRSLVVLEVKPEDVDSSNQVQAVYISMPVSVLTYFADENPDLLIEIKAPYGSYLLPVTLPALLPNWEAWLEANNWQAEQISFRLTLIDMTEDKAIQKVLAEQLPSSQPISTVVAVDLTLVDAMTGEALTEINQFTQPLIRLLPLPEELNPKSKLWGAFRYNQTSGEFTFVPARLEQRDGQWFAVIRSYSNSIYLVVENNVSFADTEQHWGKDAVAQAAAKGLVHGRGAGIFAPDSPVSRAEFVAMLVRALERNTSPLNELPYVDVQPGAWYTKAVTQAEKLGLLDFIQDNRLLPNQPLSREEMASMLAAVVRMEMASLPEQLTRLNDYRDTADMNETYLEDIQLMITLGIMQGMGAEQFSPKGETTRAQAAIVLLRTLGTLGWID